MIPLSKLQNHFRLTEVVCNVIPIQEYIQAVQIPFTALCRKACVHEPCHMLRKLWRLKLLVSKWFIMQYVEFHAVCEYEAYF